jgi:hypothetical protein
MGPVGEVVAACLELERIDGRKLCFEFLREVEGEAPEDGGDSRSWRFVRVRWAEFGELGERPWTWA